MHVMSPSAFTPADLSALQERTHPAINQPVLITSGHLHGLGRRGARSKNANVFSHLLVRVGWSRTTWVACCGTVSSGGTFPVGGGA